MRLTSREDIGAPIGLVFAAASDFDAHSRMLLRRGVEVQRLDNRADTGPGMIWRLELRLRGKQRRIQVELTDHRPDTFLAGTLDGASLHGVVTVNLIALSADRCRLDVSIDVRPASFSGRILLQSLRLGHARVSHRINQQIRSFAQDTEEKYRAGRDA